MIESQISPAFVTPLSNSVDLVQVGALVEPERFAFERIGKTILRLRDTAVLQLPPPSTEITLPALEAMQRLVEMMAKLRSPVGGCPSDLEQTPENLTPYLMEEAQEVLDALQSQPEAAQVAIYPPLSGSLVAIEDLIPGLLWHVARSAYEIMRLLEGVCIWVLEPGQTWESGMLRLVALLEIETAGIHWAFDLATGRSLRSPLHADAAIRLNTPTRAEGETYCELPNLATDWLQKLLYQVHTTSPLIQQFTDRLDADLLVPGRFWQAGTICLKFAFEFVADWHPLHSLLDEEQAPLDEEATSEEEAISDEAVAPTEAPFHALENTTLEDFAGCVAPTIATASTVDNTAGDTLEDFAFNVIQAIDSPKASSQDKLNEATLEDFAFGVSPAIVTPLDFNTELDFQIDSSTGETLEDFAALVSQAINPPSPEFTEPPSSGDTLADLAVEIAQTIAVSVVEVLPVETADSHQPTPTPLERVTTTPSAAQTIEIASVEVLPTKVLSGQELEQPLFQSIGAIAESFSLTPAPAPAIEFRFAEGVMVQFIQPDLWEWATVLTQGQSLLIKRETTLADEPNHDSIAWIIQQAYELTHPITDNTAFKERSPTLLLTEFMPNVLWQITRTTYEVMRLVGGIEARVLQPQLGWQMGTLRLLIVLQLKTPDTTWNIDLATGQDLGADILSLDADAIVRSDEIAQYQQPTQVETLFANIIAQTQTAAPQLKRLMDSANIKMHSPEGDWHPATLQLNLNLAFKPHTY